MFFAKRPATPSRPPLEGIVERLGTYDNESSAQLFVKFQNDPKIYYFRFYYGMDAKNMSHMMLAQRGDRVKFHFSENGIVNGVDNAALGQEVVSVP